MMKVNKLIELLKKENQDAQVFAYLGAKEGWEIVDIGLNDAIIGRGRTKKESFVLLPVEVPVKLKKYNEKNDKN